MDAQDYLIYHFQQMAVLAEALKVLPAQVLEHRYSHEAFGSWSTLLRYRGVRMQLTFEGKDFELRIHCSASRKHPDEWGQGVWTMPHRDSAIPVSDIVQAIKEVASVVAQ